VQGSQKITRNNYRDLAKIYIKIIDGTPEFKYEIDKLHNELSKDESIKLRKLHKKMGKFKANRIDIIRYRRCS
jgi:hypothetical protein